MVQLWHVQNGEPDSVNCKYKAINVLMNKTKQNIIYLIYIIFRWRCVDHMLLLYLFLSKGKLSGFFIMLLLSHVAVFNQQLWENKVAVVARTLWPCLSYHIPFNFHCKSKWVTCWYDYIDIHHMVYDYLVLFARLFFCEDVCKLFEWYIVPSTIFDNSCYSFYIISTIQPLIVSKCTILFSSKKHVTLAWYSWHAQLVNK